MTQEQRETEALDAALAEWEQRIADRQRAEAEIVARRWRDIRLGGKA